MWEMLVAVLVTMLFTAGIAFAGLWLGWNARDKVGQSLKEAYVGPVGVEPALEEPIILEDFVPNEDTDGEEEDDW